MRVPHAGTTSTCDRLMSQVQQGWDDLTAEEQAEYERRAAADHARFESEMRRKREAKERREARDKRESSEGACASSECDGGVESGRPPKKARTPLAQQQQERQE